MIRNSVIAASLAVTALAHAQEAVEVATDPVGFVKLSVPANSDAIFSIALNRPEAYSGIIGGIINENTLQIEGAEWEDNIFSNKYFILITSGERNGLTATINSNTSHSLALQFISENLGIGEDSVKPGDMFKIIPYWTLGTLLPDGAIPDGTTVGLYNYGQAGVNVSPSDLSTMYSGYGWYDGAINKNDVIIYSDECFFIRNSSPNKLDLNIVGIVRMTDFRTKLSIVQQGVTQDIFINTGSPVPVKLGDFLADEKLGDPGEGDSVLIFNNDAVGYNKSAPIIANYYKNYGWYDGALNLNAHLLQPGWGIVYRKAGSNPTVPLVFKPEYVD